MKIYVIVKGEYSDFHICGVAIDKANAENLARLYSDKWEKAEVVIYDTDDYKPVLDGKTAYRVTFFKNGDVYKVSTQSLEYFEPIVEKISCSELWDGADLHVCVYADDEKSAIKIASEKRAKFLAKKHGL